MTHELMDYYKARHLPHKRKLIIDQPRDLAVSEKVLSHIFLSVKKGHLCYQIITVIIGGRHHFHYYDARLHPDCFRRL